EPDTTGHRRGDPVRHQEQRPVKGASPDFLVGQERGDQRDDQRHKGDAQGKDDRVDDADPVLDRRKELLEIAKPHEKDPVAKGRHPQERKAQRLKRRPEKEDQRDHKLRQDQDIREPAVFKNGSFQEDSPRSRPKIGDQPQKHPISRRQGLLVVPKKPALKACRQAGAGPHHIRRASAKPQPAALSATRSHYWYSDANSRKSWLERRTASSRPCLAVFCPRKMFSSSSSMTSRICTKLPSRMPRVSGVGGE